MINFLLLVILLELIILAILFALLYIISILGDDQVKEFINDLF